MKKIVAGFLCYLMLINLNVVTATDHNGDDYVQNLIQLKIVDADDVRENEHLTYTECFNFILRAVGSNKVDDLEYEWKYGGFKKLLGNRPDWQKEIICKMSSLIVLQGEWKDIDFDADCTHESAITYCVRAVVDIDGCVWSPAVYESTDAVYKDAFAKGIIESVDITNSDKPITRGEFFKILNKTLYVEYTRGGYSGTRKERIIDRFTEKPQPTPSYEERMKDFITAAKPASAEEVALSKNGKVEDYGLLDGFPEAIDMNRVATRAELAVIISRIMGYSYIGSFRFKDFDHNAWYSDDFARAAFCNIIKGFDGYVRPDDNVTREEANIMISRAFMLEDYKGLAGEPNDSVSFAELFTAFDELIDVYYTLPRAYDNEQNVINGNVIITSPDTVLKNTIINGNLYIAAKVCNEHIEMLEQERTVVYDGRLVLDNVTVNGDLVLPYIYGEKFYLIDCNIKAIKWLRDADNSKLFITYSNDAKFLNSGKNIRLNDDFTLSWELPDNTLGLGMQWVYAYDEEGKKVASYGGFRNELKVDTQQLLEFVTKAYPKKLSRVEVSYNGRNPLAINLDKITVRVAGSTLHPATLIENGNYGTTLTLAEGEFKEGNWYCVTREYQDPYEPEENKVIITNKKFYMAKQGGKSCLFDNFFGYMGGGPRTGISIQGVTLSGNAESGFDIKLTPQSAETFTVVNT